MQYAWLIWSLILLSIWLVIYISLTDKHSRKEMLIMSFWTSLLGLTEPFFVPEYWDPPSLFNLAARTGFDIESLLFAFGVGGIVVVIYEKLFHTQHVKIESHEQHSHRHKYHLPILFLTPLLFALLLFFVDINPIYSTFIALMIGGFATWYCRPDLKKKMFVSAIIFTIFYFIYFLTLIIAYPGYVDAVWNLPAISAILFFGVPIEELMFAFGLGFFWSSMYEHTRWYKVVER